MTKGVPARIIISSIFILIKRVSPKSSNNNNNNNNNNQRTNGPVNAHLISGPCISTKHTKPG